ncbi:MAG: hypothetical protein K0U68_05390 [Gammaproteobacteria bacterium]|nr:hypothetical protein [Gammaproteobacteria bacterium]
MMRCVFKSVFVLFFCVCAFQSHAAVIRADATGFSSDARDFWGVSFDDGAGFIQSVSFDVSNITGMHFDFDPSSASFLGNPVIGSKNGLSNQDITIDFNGTSPTLLTFHFEQDSFSSGDSFRFQAETDNPLILSQISAEIHQDTLFTVLLQDGTSASGNFAVLSTITANGISQAGVTIETLSTIPIPAAIWLFGCAVLPLLIRYRKA